MKKFLSILVVLAIAISLTACADKGSGSASTSSNITITYTKEFSYLPAYSGMKLQSFTPSKASGDVSTAKYIIKVINWKEILQNYENILKKDGWTISQDNKPTCLVAKKGTHQVALLLSTNGKGTDVTLGVVSK